MLQKLLHAYQRPRETPLRCQAIFPSLKASVQEAVIKNIEDQFARVFTCIETNLGSINEKLTSIGERHDSIQQTNNWN